MKVYVHKFIYVPVKWSMLHSPYPSKWLCCCLGAASVVIILCVGGSTQNLLKSIYKRANHLLQHKLMRPIALCAIRHTTIQQ